MTYRNDLDALAARQAALELEVQTKTRERDDAARLLDEARTKAKLPILDNIRVATPCRADWNQMVGDARARMCLDCNKHVYNISGMTRDEAEALIIEKEGDLCVRYFQRADGTMLLADCEVGKQQKRNRRIVAASATAMLAGGGLFAWKHPAKELERVKLESKLTPLEEHDRKVVPVVAPPEVVRIAQPAYHTMGVPPPPSAEELLRYRELKSQAKPHTNHTAKKRHP
jgi:hypothetical protein